MSAAVLRTGGDAQTHRRRERQDAEGLSLRIERADRPPVRSGVQARTDAAGDAAARRVLRQVHDRYAERVSRELVRRRQACAESIATARSTSLVSTRASRYRSGARRAGFIPTTRAAGSNGIAAIISGAACLRRTGGRSSAGRRCAGTSGRSSAIASAGTSSAARGSARRCCIGPMTAARSDAQG